MVTYQIKTKFFIKTKFSDLVYNFLELWYCLEKKCAKEITSQDW